MIAVVIPAYRCKRQILQVVQRIPPLVDVIIVVDDKCPELTGHYVQSEVRDPRLKVCYNEVNQGVGGAVIRGYQEAEKMGCFIAVKIDGDGQMDPTLIESFIAPILDGRADYCKGNRFYNIESLQSMPALRIVGNAALSFFAKISSGYWMQFDPNNGYTALHLSLLPYLSLEKVSRRFFFESDLLFRLNLARAVVEDIPMTALYADEKSNLRELHSIPTFLRGHSINIFKRIVYQYFLRSFSIASLELLIGAVAVLFGVFFGAVSWYVIWARGEIASSGTVMLASLPIIVGTQLLLNFFAFDFQSVPFQPVHPNLVRHRVKK